MNTNLRSMISSKLDEARNYFSLGDSTAALRVLRQADGYIADFEEIILAYNPRYAREMTKPFRKQVSDIFTLIVRSAQSMEAEA